MKYLLLYLVVEILHLVHEISSFPEVIYELGDLKNISKLQINTRGIHPEVFCEKISLTILLNSKENVFAGVPFFKAAGCKPEIVRSSHSTRDVLLKKGFIKRRTGVSEPAVHRSATQNSCF